MKKVIILIVAIATVLFIALGTSKAASASAEEEIGNVCWLTGQDGAFLPEGEWELTPTESVGTHSISGMWCGPISEPVQAAYEGSPECPPGEVPQWYGPDVPCGPTDPCITSPDDPTKGTGLWFAGPCIIDVVEEVPETTVAVDTPPATPVMTELPATGEVTDILVLAAAIVLAAGVFAYITTKFNRS